jgi:hypothetical protein
MPLSAEERAELNQQVANFESSPVLQHLAEKGLLPQQNDIPSFEHADVFTMLRRSIFGHTKKEQGLIKRQEEILLPFLQEQKIRAGLNAAIAGAPPSVGMAEAQNPLAFEMSGGLRPTLQGIPQPPALPGQTGPAPLDVISPPAMAALSQQPMPPSQAEAYMSAVPQALHAMGAMAVKQGASEKITNPVDQAIGVMSKGKYRTLQEALDAGDIKVAEAGFEKAKLLIPKEIYAFQQGEQAKRQVEVAGPVAEAGARSRQQVETETKFAGGVQILDSLTKLTPELFLSEKGGASARAAAAVSIRQRRASGSDPGILQYDQIRNGLRGRLVQLGGDVGNFSQTEQDRAIALIPDPEGGFMSTYPFVKLPDTLEVAQEKLKLLGEFLRIGLEAPKGPSQQSDVQKRLREIVTKVDRLVQTQAGVGGTGKKNLADMTEEELRKIIRGD